MNIGVISRLPSTVAISLTPCHSWVAGNRCSTHLRSRFSSKSSSPDSPSLTSLTAV